MYTVHAWTYLVYFRIGHPIPGIPRRPICRRRLPARSSSTSGPATHMYLKFQDIFAAPEVVALQLKRQPAVASPSN